MSPEQEPGSLTGTVMRGATLAGAGWVLGQLMNFGFYLVLARLATPTDFGQLAAGAFIVVAGEIFAESGMLAALIHRRDRLEEAANTAFIATIIGGVGLSLIALALSPLVGLFFDSGEIAQVAAATSGWILLRSATTVPDALMQRRFSFLRRVVVEPVGILVFGVVSVIAVANGLGVWGLVIGNTAQRLAMVIAAWALVRWRPRPRLASMEMWRELVGYGRHVITANLIGRVGRQINTALIGRFVGTAGLGQFVYAARIAQKPYGIVLDAGSYVLFPAFARISENESRLRAAYLRSLRWISVLAIPVGFVMIPLGVPFAVLLFGETWRDAGYAAMAMFGYIGGRSVAAVCSEVFKASGRPDVLPRVHLLSAVLGVGFVVALLPFGLVGVAAAVSVSRLGVAAYSLRRAAEVTGASLRRELGLIWPPVLAAAVMAGAVYALDRLLIDATGAGIPLGLLLVGGELALAVAIYAAMLRLLAPATASDALALIRRTASNLSRRGGDRREVVDKELTAAPTTGK